MLLWLLPASMNVLVRQIMHDEELVTGSLWMGSWLLPFSRLHHYEKESSRSLADRLRQRDTS